QAATELDELSADKYDPAALQERLDKAQSAAQDKAQKLSEARSKAAKKLSTATMQSISDLHMGSAEVEIRVEQIIDTDGLPLADGHTVRVDSTGIDSIGFLIAPNMGETLKPIGRIASGGETARM